MLLFRGNSEDQIQNNQKEAGGGETGGRVRSPEFEV